MRNSSVRAMRGAMAGLWSSSTALLSKNLPGNMINSSCCFRSYASFSLINNHSGKSNIYSLSSSNSCSSNVRNHSNNSNSIMNKRSFSSDKSKTNIDKTAAAVAAVAKKMEPTVGPSIKLTFIETAKGGKTVVNADIGKSVLDAALKNNIDIEAACGGEMACSTCHTILSEELFNRLPKKSEEEQDMLDLAWGLEKTSRLCCQIKVTADMAGTEFKIPAETHSML